MERSVARCSFAGPRSQFIGSDFYSQSLILRTENLKSEEPPVSRQVLARNPAAISRLNFALMFV